MIFISTLLIFASTQINTIQYKGKIILGHIDSKFAHGDFADIQRRSQQILKEMGVENWEISHTVASYHSKRCYSPVSTDIGRVVRQVARNKIEENREQQKKVAAMAAA